MAHTILSRLLSLCSTLLPGSVMANWSAHYSTLFSQDVMGTGLRSYLSEPPFVLRQAHCIEI